MSHRLLGSLLSATYREEIAPALVSLPERLRHLAGESLTDTLGVAGGLGERGAVLIAPAKRAFLDGMHVTALVSAAIVLLGALFALRWLPGKSTPAPAVDQHSGDRKPAVV